MVQTTSWGNIKPNQSSGSSQKNNDLFVKLGEGQTKIRLAGKQPAQVYILWIKGTRYIVPEKYVSRLENLGLKPRLYYAINCFDRSDTAAGEVKFRILEKGPSIFSAFSAYFNATGEDPGGMRGPDWVISGTIPPGKKPRDIRYTVTPVAPVPFSEEEIKLISLPDMVKKGKVDEEQWKKLPMNKRGPINFEKFYDEEKWSQKIEELLSRAAGLDEGMDTEDVETALDEANKQLNEENNKEASKKTESSIDDIIDSGSGSSSDDKPFDGDKSSEMSDEKFQDMLDSAF